MTKVKPKHGNETKSTIFTWDILKSDAIYFLWSKNIKVFRCISKSKFLRFMTKVNSNNGN